MASEVEIKKRKRGRPVSRKQLDISFVIDVAIEVFAEKGFDGAQLKEIAERAGVSKSLMTYHFQGKEDLWEKSVSSLGKLLSDRLHEVGSYFKDLEGLMRMKAYTRQFIYFCAEYPEFYKILSHEICVNSERSVWLFKTILKPIYDFGDMLLKNAAEEGSPVGKVPVANMASIIMGAANTFFIHANQIRALYGIDVFTRDEIEKHADIVNEMIFGNLENLKIKDS